MVFPYKLKLFIKDIKEHMVKQLTVQLIGHVAKGVKFEEHENILSGDIEIRATLDVSFIRNPEQFKREVKEVIKEITEYEDV